MIALSLESSPQKRNSWRPGPEVIKLEFILKLKIKRNDWLLALDFEFETVLKFYNLVARCEICSQLPGGGHSDVEDVPAH